MSDNPLIRRVASLIQSSRKITILTGAGVSQESGVPTFRDAQDGLWAKYDPQQLATPEAFQRNPKLVWDWYEFRREMVRKAKPNPGHFALVEIQKRYPGAKLITQNIDDLHEQAGSRQVIHLHGCLAENKCFQNCQGDPTPVDITQIQWDKTSGPPPCPYCGGWVRPNVVWFTEIVLSDCLQTAFQACQTCDLMLVVGTSGFVTPAATMPAYAKSAGAKIVEVNPDYTMITRIVDIKLAGPSGQMLPLVVEALG